LPGQIGRGMEQLFRRVLVKLASSRSSAMLLAMSRLASAALLALRLISPVALACSVTAEATAPELPSILAMTSEILRMIPATSFAVL
jgi:hypothetical protein